MEIAAVFVALGAILFVLCFVAGEERRKVQDDEKMIREIAEARERAVFVTIADDENARKARESLWEAFGE